MMKKALVTGGAGFIGSHLAEVLIHQDWSVTVIDDCSTGSPGNVEALRTSPNFSMIRDSVTSRTVMRELIEQADFVFHLAAAVGVRLIVERPVRTIETNIEATEIILEFCSLEKKPVLLTSTSEVYGKLQKDKFVEDDDLVLGPTTRSRWCYAASKIIDEFLARAYFKETDLPVVIVRLFNTIGPRQTGHYGMVVPRFVRQALDGEPITVYGDGKQRRSFTWVEEVVQAMITLIQNTGAYGQVFNVGHTKEIAIHDLALLVRERAGSLSPIVFIPYEQAYESGFEDMSRRLPDISKIQALIGYQPGLGLVEMLDRIIRHERQRR